MASLAHLAVAMAGGRAADPSARLSLRVTLALSALSLLAEGDVVAAAGLGRVAA